MNHSDTNSKITSPHSGIYPVCRTPIQFDFIDQDIPQSPFNNPVKNIHASFGIRRSIVQQGLTFQSRQK